MTQLAPKVTNSRISPWSEEKMIGSSLPLCYHQIAVPELLYHRALCFSSPLTKHIRLVGLAAFSSSFFGLKLVPSERRCLVSPTSAPKGYNANRWAAEIGYNHSFEVYL